jgi:hypothetical protein
VVHKEQAVASLDSLEVVVIAHKRANLGLRFPCKELAPDARGPEGPLQLEAVVADRIAISDYRIELMCETKGLPHVQNPTTRGESARVSAVG